MTKVVLVGDAPNRHNTNANIPFVGTRSFSAVVEWLKALKVDYYLCYNSWTVYDINHVKTLSEVGFKIVALGNTASGRLKSARVNHYKLPHPSGLNRKLNDKQTLKILLADCCDYVHDRLNPNERNPNVHRSSVP